MSPSLVKWWMDGWSTVFDSEIQVHIVQSNGRMTYVQLFSMLFSLFMLTYSASRAFYIQRWKDEADPVPNLHMICKVFPFMLMQVMKLQN